MCLSRSDQLGLPALRAGLLAWYDEQNRALPWRVDTDPYRVWLSEMMLQQTQVKTVIPYFEAFVRRFPRVEDLAAASLESVLALWSGLGYYRRARSLHQTAVEVAARGGKFPQSSRELQQLPGIGPYTAAAIASIAFGESCPVLDGNVERVLARCCGFADDPKRRAVRQQLLAAAAALLAPDRPGDSNQALMELGAQVCRPHQPECGKCPLRAGCVAFAEGNPERFPRQRARRPPEKIELAVALVLRRGRVLLFKRPEDSDFLPGRWELPTVERELDAERLATAFERRYGGGWKLGEATMSVRHSVTFRAFKIWVHPAELTAAASGREGPAAAWVLPEERQRLPTSSLVEKILRGTALSPGVRAGDAPTAGDSDSKGRERD